MSAAWGLACLDQAAVDHVVGAGDVGGAAAVPLTQKGLAQLFLGACMEPDVERIIFLDVPAVLGWEA